MSSLEIFALQGIGEIVPGCDIAADLCAATALAEGDVLVVTQKIVSKAEGRLQAVNAANPAERRRLIERESVRVLRRRGELLICETPHGFVCANAGVDFSNVPEGYAALLPLNSDRSARRIRDAVFARAGVKVGVVVTDTFGRPWRRGLVDVAIGCAGVKPILDLRGCTDALGRSLQVTEVAIVDEIAAAAELVMGKDRNFPAAVIRGLPSEWLDEGSVEADLVRCPNEDLFR